MSSSLFVADQNMISRKHKGFAGRSIAFNSDRKLVAQR